MASPTNIVKKRRAIRKAGAGKWRKAKLRNLGSTAPNLKLDKPNANEKAQAAAAKRA